MSDSLLVLVLAAGFAFCAFLLQPLMPFVDAGRLGAAAGVVAVAMVFFAFDAAKPGGMSLWAIPAIPMGALALGLVIWAFLDARAAASANSARCLQIEHRLYQPTRRTRQDLPELFQALACHPQGR